MNSEGALGLVSSLAHREGVLGIVSCLAHRKVAPARVAVDAAEPSVAHSTQVAGCPALVIIKEDRQKEDRWIACRNQWG